MMKIELEERLGFQITDEVRASIPVDTLNKVMNAWKNLGIKADLEEIK